MKKLLLISSNNMANLPGVYNKIIGQGKGFKHYGFDVYWLYRWHTEIRLLYDTAQTYHTVKICHNLFTANLFFFSGIWKTLVDIQPDILYIRHPSLCTFDYIRFLKKSSAKGFQLFTEIPTYPYDSEYRDSVSGKITRWIDTAYRKQLHNYISHAFTYTDYQEIFGMPVTRIENGIDVARIPVRQPGSYQKETVTLLGVANLSFWHGYDRIINGLKQYYSSKRTGRNVVFHIIGTGPEFENLQQLATICKLQHAVRFLGRRYGENLYMFYNNADMGISALAQHRLNLSHGASNLKSREYCAAGLPFALAYIDVDFPDTFPYTFQIKADDSPVTIEELLEFHNRMRRQESIEAMREYACTHLDWIIKLQPIIERLT